jgi:hypothetical protein
MNVRKDAAKDAAPHDHELSSIDVAHTSPESRAEVRVYAAGARKM